jgi:3-oxoacyl-[acyl-carrier-protein] synthase II
MGAVTPLGVGVDKFWDGLMEGRSGVGPVTLFDAAQFPVRIGAECRDFVAEDHLDRKMLKRLDRYSQFGLVACEEAFRRAGLDRKTLDSHRTAVCFGSGIGGLNELEEQHGRLLTKGPTKVSAFTIPKLMVNAVSGNISMSFGAKGESVAVTSACASATNAMGSALHMIQRGHADLVFTGGSEAALTPLALSAFAAMKALSERNDDPTRASRPFDRDRDGFVLGEGAGALIFEELTHAKRRGAHILAELIGYGSTSDAGHITQPSEDGEGAAQAMRLALIDAGVTVDDVDYISAHGTSTPLGDAAETVAIKKVFGSHARRLVVSSIKSSIGHLLGASGGVAAVATIQAMRQATIPPTINLDNPDDKCDLDYCPKTPRDTRIRVTLTNALGFGGHNACLVLRRFEG